MKRYIKTIGLLILSLVAFSACQVGFVPEGVKEQKPLKSFQEVKWLRESLYSTLRGAESPGNLFLGDMQADLFHLTAKDGNTYFPFYSWNKENLSSNDMIAAYFGSFATIIKDANYFIMRANEMKANEELMKTLKDDEPKKLDIYIAEARALRALANYRLMCRFSKRYSDNDGQEPGIILIKEYDPLLQKTNKKRATQKEVYEWCLNELEEASKIIPNKDNFLADPDALEQDGIPCYLIKDYCYAVRARIFLEMHRYQDAIKEVDRFITRYPLGEATTDGLKKLWITENSSEIMIKTYATQKVGRVYGILHGLWIYDNVNPNTGKKIQYEFSSPTWFPNQYLIDLYKKSMDPEDPEDSKEDLRGQVWLEDTDGRKGTNDFPVFYGEVDGQDVITFVSKFRGNPRLDTDAKRNRISYAHSTHLFDIAEAWLIKAEAQAWSGDWTAAKTTLETFRKSRGLEVELKASNQKEMMETIKNERTRELVGMGTRMTDLKRWGDPIDRTNKPLQEGLTKGQAATTVTKSYLDLKKDASDVMFYWEFPLQDRFANKELEHNWK
ncbi:RagB/SusD family nutrient uptake outer membrane protein [uncultured Porphyromonas sp.]|uniref:RagB/SusD family nutrient uptake outer membrane protein n=1 Tax=uncultured Porphyromonas sp. TaxID=159274 RepID=UPI0028048261|nr:RagB/SusD family nutrient uptake outer membrane protein [uncultured Porphyromonas sp.]